MKFLKDFRRKAMEFLKDFQRKLIEFLNDFQTKRAKMDAHIEYSDELISYIGE